MKYALVDGQRQEAKPDLLGVCPACGSPMVAKCGKVRVNHWAHRGRRNCDPWWENETEWHRAWKNRFPKDWQEYIQNAKSGEKHVADVKTDQGWVFEFQYSYLKPEERRSREDFYQKLIWIVNGARRKRDKPQFFRAWKKGRLLVKELGLWTIPYFSDECALLRDWGGSSVPVFFDFSGCDEPEDTRLWWLVQVARGMAWVVGPVTRASLIRHHSPEAKEKGLDFAGRLKDINEAAKLLAQRRRVRSPDPRAEILRRTERKYQARLRGKRNRPFD